MAETGTLRPWSRLQLYSSARGSERARRPTDALLLAASLVGLAAVSAFSTWFAGLRDVVAAFVKASPGLFGWLWELSYDALLAWSVLLFLAPIVARNWGLWRDELLAVVGSLAVVGFLLSDSDVVGALFRGGPPEAIPAPRIALATALVATASPHLSRPFKRVGHWVVGLGAGASLALLATTPGGLAAGLAVGYGSAALVHLVFGSPGGRPSLAGVAAALEELGVTADGLAYEGLAPAGAALVSARDGQGALVVRVFGRDAWGGQLIVRLWESVWYRGSEPGQTAGRLQQVEREAFVTLLAERAGVPVQPVVAAGRTESGDALLVIRDIGTRVAEMEPDQITDPFLEGLWQAHRDLSALQIAHGEPDLDHIVMLDDGTPALRDFSSSSPGAPETSVLRDRAQLLVTTSLLVGQARAIAAAVDVLGAEPVGDTLPFLQPAALSKPTREAMSNADLKELRGAVATATGEELPKLQPLRRVTIGSVLMAAVMLAAAYMILSAIADVGLAEIAEDLREADQAWIWAGLALGVAAQLGQAFSTMGASYVPIRFSSSAALQLAIQFVSVAVPSSAARVAMLVRFFQRNGATAPAAMTIGAIDAFSGFLIQAAVVLFVWVSGAFALGLDLSVLPGGSSEDGSSLFKIVGLAVVLAIVAAAAALIVPRFRRQVRDKARSAREPLRVLRSPRKVLMLFGGNLVGQLLLAAALGACLRSMGYELPLAQLLFINTLVALFSGLMPVPGGVGVTEAAITTCLTAAGIPSSIALSTAMVFRIMTFYLPPLWGGPAVAWLRRRDYL